MTDNQLTVLQALALAGGMPQWQLWIGQIVRQARAGAREAFLLSQKDSCWTQQRYRLQPQESSSFREHGEMPPLVVWSHIAAAVA